MLFDGQSLNFEVVSGAKVDKKYAQKGDGQATEEAKQSEGTAKENELV